MFCYVALKLLLMIHQAYAPDNPTAFQYFIPVLHSSAPSMHSSPKFTITTLLFYEKFGHTKLFVAILWPWRGWGGGHLSGKMHVKSSLSCLLSTSHF